MTKKMVGVFICAALIFLIMPIGIQADFLHDPLDGGWLEEREGVKILHESGSYYDMGYQHGYLLSDEIPILIRIMFETLQISKGTGIYIPSRVEY